MKRLFFCSAVLFVSGMVSGCGGGDSVASTGTPPTVATVPAPTGAVVNATLDGPLKSETFNALSTRYTGVSTSSGVQNTVVSGPSTNATVSYDAATNSYHLSSPGTSASGQSPDAVIADVVQPDFTEASSSPCTSGTCSAAAISRRGDDGVRSSGFVYTYVAYGRWFSSAPTGSGTAETMNAAVFGATTPANAIPTSGTASYTLDVNGQELTGPLGTSGGHNIVPSYSGNGTAAFDFGAGTFSMNGSMNSIPNYPDSVTFSASGKLSSGANGYAGTFSFNDAGAFKGSVGGWFFGPQAQEMGAVFSASASDGRVAVGTIVGHK
ncbi:transferrin-binding protein-like solute binding protein [Novosphingobium sp. BL-8A]|uniref:transferrin-binding protein-like solute binding protein n=1 Tax=Novosphingobium sp. BL-8A TaxID=3127639 RepID=UPI003757234E